jgi:hypothetical protein
LLMSENSQRGVVSLIMVISQVEGYRNSRSSTAHVRAAEKLGATQ